MTIRLELLAEQHLAGLARLVDDPDVLRFTRVPDPPPDGFHERWLAGYETARLDGTREGFAIIDDADVFVGIAVAAAIDGPARTAELGYTVLPEARGRGIATDALRLLTTWAFDELGMLRCELLIGAENAGSKRVAERSGYVYEGTLRSKHFKQDRREDTELWSRLPTD